MRALGWLAPVVAVGAVFLLPAVTASAPLVGTESWTVAQVGVEVAERGEQTSLRDAVERVRRLQQQMGVKPTAGLKKAVAAGAMIPVALVVAGAAALLSWVWLLAGWRRVFLANAAVGVLATGYVLGASWWLTRLLQTAAGDVLQELGVKGLAGLAGQISITPQAGLGVLGLSLVAMLVWPEVADQR